MNEEISRRKLLVGLVLGGSAIALGLGAIPRNSQATIESSDPFDFLIRDAENKKYVLIGETHPEKGIIKLLSSLINVGKFDKFFLEALMEGDYRVMGDVLKKKENVYGWDSEKYDYLLNVAISNNLEVHGIDNHRERLDDGDETSKWARYIINNSGKKNLILVGSNHIDYWRKKKATDTSLPKHLELNGIPHSEFLTVASFETNGLCEASKCEFRQGLYQLDNLPQIGEGFTDILKRERIADYVWLHNGWGE